MSAPIFVLSDHYENWINLNPLTLSKPISLLRVGISTIQEKWQHYTKETPQIKTCAPYLSNWDTWKPKPNSG